MNTNWVVSIDTFFLLEYQMFGFFFLRLSSLLIQY